MTSWRLLSVVLALAVPAVAAPERIRIEWRDSACMVKDSAGGLTLRRRASGGWRVGRRVVADDVVERLRAALLAPPVTYEDLRAGLSLDEAVIEEQAGELAGILRDEQGLTAEAAHAASRRVSRELAADAITTHVSGRGEHVSVSTSGWHARLEVEVPGSPPITASVAGSRALLVPCSETRGHQPVPPASVGAALPRPPPSRHAPSSRASFIRQGGAACAVDSWHVIHEGVVTETWSLELVAAVGRIMEASGRGHAKLDVDRALEEARRHRWSRRVLIFAARHVAPSVAEASSTPDPDAAPVRALLAAKDVTTLDAAYAAMDREDVGLRVVHRTRRLALQPTPEAELAFLQALPATEGESLRMIALLDPEPLRSDAALQDIVEGSFGRAARLAPRHPGFHRRVLELCLISDGTVADFAWEACDWLVVHDAAATLAALRCMPEAERRRLCGGEDPALLADADGVRACTRDLRREP